MSCRVDPKLVSDNLFVCSSQRSLKHIKDMGVEIDIHQFVQMDEGFYKPCAEKDLVWFKLKAYEIVNYCNVPALAEVGSKVFTQDPIGAD
ncbi:hypothetical protein LSUCC0031_04910 [Rhodobacterales bacterium LSUCC0031]|nr:hypothetical protein [Rhodobacterales bacterium LSUCC0031]